MTRRKLEQIMTFLHFNNNSDTPPPADRISKVKPFWIIFYQNFNLYTQIRANTWWNNDKDNDWDSKPIILENLQQNMEFWSGWLGKVKLGIYIYATLRFIQVKERNLEKARAPHSSTLPGKSHRWRSLVGCSPWGH